MKHYLSLIIIFSITAMFSFINQMVYANYFGAGKSFDILNAVLSLPFAIIGIGSGALSLIVMPVLHEAQEKYGDCSTALVVLLKKYYKYIILLSVAIIFTQIVFLYNSVSSVDKLQFIKLSILSAVFLFMSFINSFFIVFYNLRKNYFLASINAMVTYVFSIVMCYFFALDFGIDIIIYSFICSNIFLLFLYYYNFSIVSSGNNRATLKVVKIEKKVVLGGIFSILPFTLPVFIDSFFLLSSASGSLSYVSYANKIIVMISSILIQPLNLILFPKILEKISKNDFSFIKKLLLFLYLIVFIGVIAVYILSKFLFLDFMNIFFVKGAFTENDANMVYKVFLLYLIGAFGMVSMNIQNKVLTALKLFKLQIYSAIVFILVYFVGMMYFVKNLGYLASGYSYAISWSIYTLLIVLVIYLKLKGIQCYRS